MAESTSSIILFYPPSFHSWNSLHMYVNRKMRPAEIISSAYLKSILYWVIYSLTTVSTANQNDNCKFIHELDLWRKEIPKDNLSKGRIEEKMIFAETECYCPLWLLKLLLGP
jgi:hypothetical protein